MKKQEKKPRKTSFFLKIIFFSGLSFFLLLNLYFSQKFSFLIVSLANNPNKNEAILFLKKIKNTKFFPLMLNYFQSIYGKDIENEVFFEENQRKEEIKKLKLILEKNPKARDLLLKLAVLYFEDNNFSQAKFYYQKAKEIDPAVKIEELERL